MCRVISSPWRFLLFRGPELACFHRIGLSGHSRVMELLPRVSNHWIVKRAEQAERLRIAAR
jgi:hypothetical protein